ncbi:unnamed protein product [Withania somnifera]
MASLFGPSNPIPPPLPRSPRPDPLTRKNVTVPGSKNSKELAKERNKKMASEKAISIILRREATKALIENKKKKGNSKKLLPRTVLEALHERITALRWQSALKVFELLQEQLWYRPNAGIYIKLIVMLGKCKEPEKAQSLFEMMVEEGCVVNQEAYTALLSAYSRSGHFHEAFSILEVMKNTLNCQPDVFTYTILIKSCLQVYEFHKVQILLSDMECMGIKPNTVTYNTLIDSYGKAKRFKEMESTLVEMLRRRDCKPDVWTMNSTLRAFGGSGQIELMEKCYEKFQSAGIEPSIKTFNILLDSYGKTENYEKMSAVMEFMQKYHFSWTIVTYNIVIDSFGRAGDLKQMEFLFRLMQSERIRPNCVTLCSLVRAYGKAVDAYGTMGCFTELKGVLEMMERSGCKPDKITYRSMIKAYSINGMTRKVTELRNLLASLEKAQ